MSRCINFTVFLFVMVSNNKKAVPYQRVMLFLLSNNINKLPPWMLSLEIFWSACAAAAAVYRQIRCRPLMPAGASQDIFNEYNNTSQFCRSAHKISCSIFFFHFLYMLKTNGTELIDESADVCLHFSGHVTSPAFGRVLSFLF